MSVDTDSLPWIGLDALRATPFVAIDARGARVPKVRDVAEDVHGIHVKVLIPNSNSYVFDGLRDVAEAYAYLSGGRLLRGEAAKDFIEP